MRSRPLKPLQRRHPSLKFRDFQRTTEAVYQSHDLRTFAWCQVTLADRLQGGSSCGYGISGSGHMRQLKGNGRIPAGRG